ncbi:MAG: hypothetical protein WBB82_13350 [Limnothrix sp.]
MIKITGTIDKKDIGVGTWVLVAEDGTTYELRDLAADLKQKGKEVEITGEILENAMSMAMVGPIFAVSEVTIK